MSTPVYLNSSGQLAKIDDDIDAPANITLADRTAETVGELRFGDGDDFKIYHNGTDSYLDNVHATAGLYVRTGASPTTAIHIGCTQDATFYGNVKVGDGKRFYAGDGNDFFVEHTGPNTHIENHVGSFYIINGSASGSIIFRTSASQTTALTIDSSQNTTFATDALATMVSTYTTGSGIPNNVLYLTNNTAATSSDPQQFSPSLMFRGRAWHTDNGTPTDFAISGSTVTLTDTGATFTSEDVGRQVIVSGATSAGNDGTFTVTGQTGTTLTYENASGVTETGAGTWTTGASETWDFATYITTTNGNGTAGRLNFVSRKNAGSWDTEMYLDKNGLLYLDGDLNLAAGKNIYLDSGYGHERIYHPSDGIIDIYAGANRTLRIEETIVRFDGNVLLGDDDELRLGAGNDFRLIHDGTDNIIGSYSTTADLLFKTGSTSSPTTALTIDENQTSTFSGQLGSALETQTDVDTTVTVDCDNGNVHHLTVDGNITTLTVNNPEEGFWYHFVIEQAGTGSYTVAWPASFKWPGGSAPTLSTAVGAVDVIHGVYVNSEFLMRYDLNHS